MDYNEMKDRFDKLNKLIEAMEGEKAPEEFVDKLKAELVEVKWKMIEHLRIAPDTFESEYPANFS